MSQRQVIRALKTSKININSVIISTKKINNSAKISYNKPDYPFVIQTPFLEVLTPLVGISGSNTGSNTESKISHLTTLFKGDTPSRVNSFNEFIDDIEGYVQSHIETHHMKLFNENSGVDMKSLIKIIDQEKKIYGIKWIIKSDLTEFLDEYKNPFDPKNLQTKDLVKIIFEIPDLYISDANQCMLAALVRKILVKKSVEEINSEYVFDSDSDSDNETADHQDFISLLATEQNTAPNSVPNPSKHQSKTPPKPLSNIKSTNLSDELNIQLDGDLSDDDF